MSARKKIIIVGAGFGGLFAARELSNKIVDVLVIDKNNFHTFTPLLYQVATSALDPSQIAYPVRTIFRKKDNIEFMLGKVTGINHAEKQVLVQSQGREITQNYDYLILAGGSEPAYFGLDEFKQHSFELRTLEDAINLRNHILGLFEFAAWTKDYQERQAALTIVVVGGGPTGIETAGAIYELYNHVLNQEYPQRDLHARVVLVELKDHLLTPYPENLQTSALKQLRSLGVEVILNTAVDKIGKDKITLSNGSVITSHTLVWAAGAQGVPLGNLLGIKLINGSQVPINRQMEVAGMDCVYAVGDIAYLADEQGGPYPMMIPVAIQQGTLAAKNIMRKMRFVESKSFAYEDRGMMATIGRSRAVAWLYKRVRLSGWLAWVVWLVFHLMTLLGFRNRVNVFIDWVWNYFTYDRSVRAIVRQETRGDK